MNKLFIKIGLLIRKFGKLIQSNYWKCSNCGHIDFYEKEVLCWKCKGLGEMIYKGE